MTGPTPPAPKQGFRKLAPGEVGLSRFRLRLWHGMALGAWLTLMRGNWHLVPPSRYGLALSVTLFAVFNEGLKRLSDLLYGRRIAATKIIPDPVFVIGHWRSGTTWLHNLMMTDPRFASPGTGECYRPETFLPGRRIGRAVMALVMPERRPMDNVVLQPSSAEEDEIALLLSGAPSPYRVILFPDAELPGTAAMLGQLSEADRARWQRIWLRFLRSVQMIHPGKRLVLKSPTHTLRLPEILSLFPQARFVHILRDPRDVIPSQARTRFAMSAFLALTDRMSVQAGDEDNVLNDFVLFQDEVHRQLAGVPEGQVVTIRYEDLRADIPGVMRRIYDGLDLGGYEAVAPRFEARAADRAYRTSGDMADPATAARIEAACAAHMRRYGYLPDAGDA